MVPSPAPRDPLLEHERRAVLMSGYAKLAFGAVATLVVLVAADPVERSATLLAVIFSTAGSLLCIWRLRHAARRQSVRRYGLVGAAVDAGVIVSLPIIWHVSLTSEGRPLLHLLGHNYTAVIAAFVLIETATLRPVLPLLVAAVGSGMRIPLLALALGDRRLASFEGGIDRALGVGWGLDDMLIQVVFVAVLGGVAALIARGARRTVLASVELEKRHAARDRQELENLLEAKVAALSDFVAGVEHELNSPLGAIRSSADTARRAIGRLAERSDESDRRLQALSDSVSLISRAAERMDEVLRRTRGFVQLDRAELGDIELASLVENAIEVSRPGFRSEIEIESQLEPGLRARGDAARLGQALCTVLRNAGEAIDGEGTVRVRLERRTDEAVITIEDDGRGMTEAQLRDVFEVRFGGSDRTRARFGLPAARHVLRRHDGSLTIQSQPGAGTRVVLRLPLRGAPAAGAA